MSIFDTADRWDVSLDTMLPVGNHVVKIIQADGGTTRSVNAYPQIELKFEAPTGTIRDWLVYHSQLLGKVASLYDAAGVTQPQEGEYDTEDNCRLTQKCIDRLWGKTIGIVVREEDDNRNPGQKRRRVQGYVTADRITSDVPADTSGLPTAGAQANSAAQDKIPF